MLDPVSLPPSAPVIDSGAGEAVWVYPFSRFADEPFADAYAGFRESVGLSPKASAVLDLTGEATGDRRVSRDRVLANRLTTIEQGLRKRPAPAKKAVAGN